MAKKINPFRLSLEKEFGISRITDEIWKEGLRQARKIYSFKKNPLHYKYSSVASTLIREKLKEEKYKQKSLYSIMENQVGTEQEKYESAVKEIYGYRTEAFREENGNIKVEYNGEIKTLNEWYDEFGKTINKDDMNNIIDLTKKTNDYQLKEDYGIGRGAQNKDISSYFDK